MAAPASARPAEQRSARALAESIIPGSGRVPPADQRTVDRIEEVIGELSPALLTAFRIAERMLDAAAVTRTGRRLHALAPARRDQLLAAWERDPLLGPALQAIALAYKFVHFDEPDVYRTLGGRPNVVASLEHPRWLSQVHRADAWSGAEDLECDVVVVGTGAGGGVVGRELAERGHAVLFVEEGEHYRRDAFDGSSVRAHARFYRFAIALGNAAIPVFIGRLVGGSTAVNGGTCFRTPPWVLDRWCEELSTDDFAEEAMRPCFERVEEILQVAPSPRDIIGPSRDLIARGCDRLGWRHFMIRRNAPGCTGEGFCDFGCRTDARRSTNISYVPAALERGGLLFTGLRAERVLLDGDRAVGIECESATGRHLRIRARKVVLAGGSIPTPLLLLKQGICNRSGQVGRNLTLHPSSGIGGLFDDDIEGWRYVPQGYGCDQFLREGLLLTGAQPDVNYVPMMFPTTGRRLMDRLDEMSHIASMAVLARDATRNGRVWREVGGKPAITYRVTPADVALLHQGMVAAGEVLLAAGARRLYPVRPSMPIVERDDFDKLRRTPPSAADLSLISYHPLGTCRMGKDPRESVIGLDHQTHDVRDLYIVDGSAVLGPLGVNPQLTIMGVATRAADLIAAAL